MFNFCMETLKQNKKSNQPKSVAMYVPVIDTQREHYTLNHKLNLKLKQLFFQLLLYFVLYFCPGNLKINKETEHAR